MNISRIHLHDELYLDIETDDGATCTNAILMIADSNGWRSVYEFSAEQFDALVEALDFFCAESKGK